MSNRQKILMLTEYPYTVEDGSQGGIMQSSSQLINALKNIQHLNVEIELVTLSKKCKSIEHRIINRNIRIKFLPFSGNNILIRSVRKFIFLFYLFVYIRKSEADLIHGQGTIIYIIFSIFSGKKSVQTVHGIYQNELSVLGRVSFKQKIRHFVKIIIEKFYLGRIKNLICISTEIENLVKQFNSDVEVFRINNPVDQVFFENNSLSEGHIKPKNFLFVAAITPRKGLHNLLTVVRTLLEEGFDLQLTIAGLESWYPEYIAEQKLIHSSLIDLGKVQFCGEVNQEKLSRLYDQADFFVLPSLAESAPMVISQSLAKGIPVIASNVGEIPNMLDGGKYGIIVDPVSLESIKKGLIFAIECENDHFDIVSMRSWATQNYDGRQVALKTVETYERIVNLK